MSDWNRNPSSRVVDQRGRNRLIDATVTLANGRDGIDEVGLNDFFELFFDNAPDDAIPPNTTISAEERVRLEHLTGILVAACEQSNLFDESSFLASGWLERIVPAAKHALEAFAQRGRFEEEIEEEQPSRPL